MKSIKQNSVSLAMLILFLLLSYILTSKVKLKTKSKTMTKISSSLCGPLCLECSELDNSVCNVCKPGVFQYKENCYSKCPKGTYVDTEWQVCRECDQDCPICWGPRSDMCGSAVGVKTTVVLLENEIKNFFNGKQFKVEDTQTWFNKLNIIFKKIRENGLSNLVTFGIYGPSQLETFDNTIDTMSPEDVYSSKKIQVDLPEGSFSRNNGVFIPIPSYLNDKMELINSHWIFIKGMWDGRKWARVWFPKLPSFINHHGEKNKIYFENGGYWIYELGKDWYWVKSNNLKEAFTPSEDLISDLNVFKFEMGDYNTKRLQQKIDLKKMQIEDNIKQFFDKFSQTNKLIFSRLMNTINNEQNDVVGSLDDLKRRIKLYLGEEIILHGGQLDRYPVSEVNLRKEKITEKSEEKIDKNSISSDDGKFEKPVYHK